MGVRMIEIDIVWFNGLKYLILNKINSKLKNYHLNKFINSKLNLFL